MLSRLRILGAIALGLALAIPASATSLAPGGAVLSGASNTSNSASFAGYTFVAGANFTSGGVTVAEEVLKNGSGNLTFLYQYSSTSSSLVNVLGQQSSFKYYNTDVSQAATVTSLPSGGSATFVTGNDKNLTWSRAAAGDSLSELFGTPVGPGSTSYVQIIATNATAFDSGATVTLGGTTISGGLEPQALPEPATIALWGIVLAGLCVVGLRRKWARGQVAAQAL
jgi:hypothetical protein